MKYLASTLISLLLATSSVLSYGKEDLNATSIHMLMQDSQPKYFLPNDTSNHPSPNEVVFGTDQTPPIGLCVEIYKELKKRLDVQGIQASIATSFTPIKRILKRVETNPNDIFCGAGRNAKREALFTYSETVVYNVSNVVAAHQSFDFEINGFEDINRHQLTIGALYGTSSAAYVKKQTDTTINDSFLNLKTGLQAVANQQIPLFYYHDLGLNYLIKAWQLPLKVVPHKFRTVPQWIIYSKHIDPELHAKIEASLKAMEQEGNIKKIWKNYF